MAERVWRWVGLGLLLGLLPLMAAYGVRFYYVERPPGAADLLGSGDGILVAVTWAVVSLVELADGPAVRARWHFFLTLVSALLVVGGAVAYGCLTADSVTGRVQTPRQARIVATSSIALLAVAAGSSTLAVGMAAASGKGGPTCRSRSSKW